MLGNPMDDQTCLLLYCGQFINYIQFGIYNSDEISLNVDSFVKMFLKISDQVQKDYNRINQSKASSGTKWENINSVNYNFITNEQFLSSLLQILGIKPPQLEYQRMSTSSSILFSKLYNYLGPPTYPGSSLQFIFQKREYKKVNSDNLVPYLAIEVRSDSVPSDFSKHLEDNHIDNYDDGYLLDRFVSLIEQQFNTSLNLEEYCKKDSNFWMVFIIVGFIVLCLIIFVIVGVAAWKKEKREEVIENNRKTREMEKNKMNMYKIMGEEENKGINNEEVNDNK